MCTVAPTCVRCTCEIAPANIGYSFKPHGGRAFAFTFLTNDMFKN